MISVWSLGSGRTPWVSDCIHISGIIQTKKMPLWLPETGCFSALFCEVLFLLVSWSIEGLAPLCNLYWYGNVRQMICQTGPAPEPPGKPLSSTRVWCRWWSMGCRPFGRIRRRWAAIQAGLGLVGHGAELQELMLATCSSSQFPTQTALISHDLPWLHDTPLNSRHGAHQQQAAGAGRR